MIRINLRIDEYTFPTLHSRLSEVPKSHRARLIKYELLQLEKSISAETPPAMPSPCSNNMQNSDQISTVRQDDSFDVARQLGAAFL